MEGSALDTATKTDDASNIPNERWKCLLDVPNFDPREFGKGKPTSAGNPNPPKGAPKGKAKPDKPGGKDQPKRKCIFHPRKSGCRLGDSCPYVHEGLRDHQEPAVLTRNETRLRELRHSSELKPRRQMQREVPRLSRRHQRRQRQRQLCRHLLE